MSEVMSGAAPVAGTAEPHDVCVIGSGPAGAALAGRVVHDTQAYAHVRARLAGLEAVGRDAAPNSV